jgi:hypothetical protein
MVVRKRRSAADRFNVTLSTTLKVTEFIVDKLIMLMKKYIVWPDRNEVEHIEKDFRARAGYPGQVRSGVIFTRS